MDDLPKIPGPDATYVEIDGKLYESVEITPLSRREIIVCVPTPSKDGFHYVPDWWDMTHFG